MLLLKIQIFVHRSSNDLTFYQLLKLFSFFPTLVNKILASDLPCLFASLVQKYQLGLCDDTNSDKKYWRRASGNKSNERVKIFAKYFSELSLLIQSLDNYSICVRHYNKIVISNVLLEKLKAIDDSISSSLGGETNENDLK
jgi:hypothetical protein